MVGAGRRGASCELRFLGPERTEAYRMAADLCRSVQATSGQYTDPAQLALHLQFGPFGELGAHDWSGNEQADAFYLSRHSSTSC